MKRIIVTAALIGSWTQVIHAQTTTGTITDTAAVSGVISVSSPDDRIHIYPNPSKGAFYFNGVRGQTIEIYNMTGQRVYQAEADRERYPVDISSHSKGIYTYRILDQGALVQQGRLVAE